MADEPTRRPAPEEDDDTIDLGKWMLLFWSRRWFIGSVSFSFAVAAAIATFFMAPTYTSTAKLMLPSSKGDSGLASMLGQFGALAGLPTGNNSVDSAEFYKEIIKSRSMGEHLIRKFDLVTRYQAKEGPEGIESILKTLDKAINADPVKGGFLDLSVETLSSELARDMAYEVILATNETINRLNIAKAKEKRVFLEGRVDEVYTDMRILQEEIRTFYESRRIFELGEQSRRSIETVAQLLSQIESLRVRRDIQGASIGRDHPEYMTTELELKEVSKRFQQMMTRRTGEAGLSEPSPLDSFTPLLAVEEIPALNFKNLELSREMTIQANLLALLRQQFEMAKIEEKKEDLYLRVLDAPNVPVFKTSPKRRIIVLVVFFLGLLASTGWLVIQELRTTFALPNAVLTNHRGDQA